MTRPDLTSLRAAVTAAKADRDAARKHLREAEAALLFGLRDDWIARARAAYPLPEGAMEGWMTSIGTQWQIPDPQHSPCQGRLIFTADVVGNSITITTHRQDRVGEEVGPVSGGRNNTYQIHHREGKAWAQRFGVTA